MFHYICFAGSYAANVVTANNNKAELFTATNKIKGQLNDSELCQLIETDLNARKWNLFGSNEFWLENCTVSQSTLAMVCPGTPIIIKGHPFSGKETRAKMVDLDPNPGIPATQIFIGSIHVGELVSLFNPTPAEIQNSSRQHIEKVTNPLPTSSSLFGIDSQCSGVFTSIVDKSDVFLYKAADIGDFTRVVVKFILFNNIQSFRYASHPTSSAMPAYGTIIGRIEFVGRSFQWNRIILPPQLQNSHILSCCQAFTQDKTVYLDLLGTIPFESRQDDLYVANALSENWSSNFVPLLGRLVMEGQFRLDIGKHSQFFELKTDSYIKQSGLIQVKFEEETNLNTEICIFFQQVPVLKEFPFYWIPKENVYGVYLNSGQQICMEVNCFEYGVARKNVECKPLIFVNSKVLEGSDISGIINVKTDNQQVNLSGLSQGICAIFLVKKEVLRTFDFFKTIVPWRYTLPDTDFFSYLPWEAFSYSPYIRVRVLSNNDDSRSNSWEYIYNNCLRYYYLTVPSKRAYCNLSNIDVIRTKGLSILHMTNKANFKKTWYMPVTRDLPDKMIVALQEFILSNEQEGFCQFPTENQLGILLSPSITIDSISSLDNALRLAASIELFVCLQYLFAMFTLTDGLKDQELYYTSLRRLAIEEMFHFGMVQQIRLAIGMEVFIPLKWPTCSWFDFQLKSFSLESIDEWITYERESDEQNSLGGLYKGIIQALQREDIVTTVIPQVKPTGFSYDSNQSSHLYAILCKQHIINMIERIILEGEGCGGQNHSSHFSTLQKMRLKLMESGNVPPIIRTSPEETEKLKIPVSICFQLFNKFYSFLLLCLRLFFVEKKNGTLLHLTLISNEIMKTSLPTLSRLVFTLSGYTVGPSFETSSLIVFGRIWDIICIIEEDIKALNAAMKIDSYLVAGLQDYLEVFNNSWLLIKNTSCARQLECY